MSEQVPTNEPPASGKESGACCGARWRLPLLMAIVLAAIVVINGRGVRETIPSTSQVRSPVIEPAPPVSQTVGLAIDFGDGRRREWKSIDWREGITVADVLASATQLENSGETLSFAQQGTGASAFLSKAGGVSNEGAGGRNWTYRVNGERGDRSFAIYELRPGDQVLWTFGESR